MHDDVLKEMQKAALDIGHVEWGTTHARDSDGHAEHIRNTIDITAKTFDQTGDQMMHGLYVEGTNIVVSHTGTSPNSPTHARILTALWNKFVDDAVAQMEQSNG